MKTIVLPFHNSMGKMSTVLTRGTLNQLKGSNVSNIILTLILVGPVEEK